MAERPLVDHEWAPEWPESYQYDPYQYGINSYYPEKMPPPPVGQYFAPQAQQYLQPPSPTLTMLLSPRDLSPAPHAPEYNYQAIPKGDNPRELRNKAEKQRRDKLNQSISQLATMVPPVVSINKKFDKTSILRFTAHYLRAHQYVFGDAISKSSEKKELKAAGAHALLGLLNGFLLTTTYRGLVVVVSQNIQQHLGYNELDLLGQSIFKIIHPDDVLAMKSQLMPDNHFLGPHGELLVPNEPEERQKVIEALETERRKFVVRFKKYGQRSESPQYVTCVVEGSMRKSDGACRGYNRCCQMVRRARARGDNPYSSGNDIVFISVVRPISETFISERQIESFKMEYRTRHSVDGEIIQCEQRIALVTGYMTHEVNGVNAMNFMHRDDVRWVIIALRQMYDQHLLIGESCYRLMAKNGQFIYMRTRGKLDVEDSSGAVRTFVCTNTVVEEHEGKQLIQMMKKKFMCLVNCAETAMLKDDDAKDDQEVNNLTVPVEDPRNLEKVILHLVTNLPSPQPDSACGESPERCSSPTLPLAIIPPKKERILSAIEKIYSVIKSLHNNMEHDQNIEQDNFFTHISDIEDQSNDDSIDKDLGHFDLETMLRSPPTGPISTVDDPDPYQLLTNNNISFGKPCTSMLSTLKSKKEYLSKNTPKPKKSIEYLHKFPARHIVKPKPMYTIDQPGPSGLAIKRSLEQHSSPASSKRKAQIYHQSSSQNLSDDSSDGDAIPTETYDIDTHEISLTYSKVTKSLINKAETQGKLHGKPEDEQLCHQIEDPKTAVFEPYEEQTDFEPWNSDDSADI